MLSKLVIACVVGIVVFLACILVGGLLVTTTVPFVVTVGTFLKTYAGLLGLLAALFHYFAGGSTWPTRKV